MQAEVDPVLEPLPSSASIEEQQQHLKLLVEAFRRTCSLADNLQVGPVDGTSHAASLMPVLHIYAGYLQADLQPG